MELLTTEPVVKNRWQDERIDVLRIRLWNTQHVTALLGEFHIAERVLANWATKPDCSPIGFEVVFEDGYTVQGSHAFFKKGKRQCLLSTHVRKLLHANAARAGQTPSPSDALLSRYCIAA